MNSIKYRLDHMSRDTEMFEIVIHICNRCKQQDRYVFSKDLNHEVEQPYLCSEYCLTEYAKANLYEDNMADEHDELADENWE